MIGGLVPPSAGVVPGQLAWNAGETATCSPLAERPTTTGVVRLSSGALAPETGSLSGVLGRAGGGGPARRSWRCPRRSEGSGRGCWCGKPCGDLGGTGF
jgi:hypothetical protein